MRDFVRLYGPIILVIVTGLVLAFILMAPPPPKRVVIAGGAAGGAYAQTAERYAEALRERKIEAEVLNTAGSVENLSRLKAREADIAIVQSGLAGSFGADGVRSLGAIFYEPVWVFHRANARVSGLRDLRGMKVAIGAEGSGLRVLATLLLTEAGLAEGDFTPVPLGGAAAADALRAGEADAILVVSGATTAFIHDLAADPSISLLSLREANALARRHAYLDTVTLYRGVLDLANIAPEEDVTLIAPAAQIAVREGLHPAIQSLLIDVAMAEHGGGSLLADSGRFPTRDLADIPVSEEAGRYYEDGPTFLRRYFSYDVANFLERAWVLAIPLLTLAFPLVKAAPPVYRWRIRRKIYVWYQDLRDLESAGRNATTEQERTEVRDKLADLQAETGNVQVPLSYADDLYRLRAHIRFVSELVDKLSAQDKRARV
jgi:TRAP transporter TAXI family solute receptor